MNCNNILEKTNRNKTKKNYLKKASKTCVIGYDTMTSLNKINQRKS